MKRFNYLITIAVFVLATGCSSTEEIIAPTDGKVEIKATLPSPKADTRVTLDGNTFTDKDRITLYFGMPSVNSVIKGTYIYDSQSKTWSGTELYWDDFTRETVTNQFVGIANNAPVKLDVPDNSCEVKANQSSDANYIASDLLVAYATTAKFTMVELPFDHAFAHLVIRITDQTTEAPFILNDKTVVKVEGVKRNCKVVFDLANSQTNITETGDISAITTRQKGFSGKTYSCELILPVQSFASGKTLSIESKINGKTYTYDLSSKEIQDKDKNGNLDKTSLLVQGKTTTLDFTITKTDIGIISATLTDWIETSANEESTPENYPVLEIGTVDELENILSKGEDFAGKTIKLTGDIDGTTLTLPIGQCPNPFRGIFDGQGYTVSNVKLDAATPAFMGLFGCTEGATIMNLNVKNVTINNKNQNSSTATGALIGYAVDTKVLNCHVKDANVEASYDNVGGLIGYADGCTVELCSSASRVTGHHNYAGGLIGEAMLSTVTKSYAIGDVALYKVNASDIPTGYYAGGLIGYFYGKNLADCYAWGNISCGSYAGGLLGGCGNVGIESSYAAGTVSKTIGGGLIGITERLELSNVKYCYWNAKATGADNTQADGVNTGTKIAGEFNISFVLTETPVSMEPVAEGLNKSGQDWELGTGSLFQNAEKKIYALPLLLKNSGNATQANLVVIEKLKANE